VVSFDVVQPNLDGQLDMPAGTPRFSSFLDEHEVYAIQIGGGVARNIATISAQASGMDFVDLDLDNLLEREQSLTRLEKAALDWLKENQVRIEGDAVVWHYTFDHTFNNIVIKNGWPSAFAQSKLLFLRTVRVLTNLTWRWRCRLGSRLPFLASAAVSAARSVASRGSKRSLFRLVSRH
jgi:hypothetical protein